MEFFKQTSQGFRWRRIFAVSIAVSLSSFFLGCSDQGEVVSPSTEQGEIHESSREIDDRVPLVVYQVELLVGDGADPVFARMVERMLLKHANADAGLSMTQNTEEKPDVFVLIGELSDAEKSELEENVAVIRVGDRFADDPNLAAVVGADSAFAAGQFGEAARGVADGRGEVLVAPVPSDNVSAIERVNEFAKYLARVSSSNSQDGFVMVAADVPMESWEDTEKWLADSIEPSLRDNELAVLVGFNRAATERLLLRIRAVGLSQVVPLVGFGLDHSLVEAMDAGELGGVLIYDPGTLESALRVALDKAERVLKEDYSPLETVDLTVPLRWLNFEAMASDEGRSLSKPYLESE